MSFSSSGMINQNDSLRDLLEKDEATLLQSAPVIPITIKQPHFNDIKYGNKTIEGRLGNYATDKNIKKNSTLLISLPGSLPHTQPIKATVTKLVKYNTFKAMIETEGLKNILPSEYKKNSSINDAVAIYRQFYSQDKEKQHGALAIGVRVMKSVNRKKSKKSVKKKVCKIY